MPDRYDPKLSVRSFGDRKPADPGHEPHADESDPLAELARIVSGRTAPEAPASRPRTTPTSDPRGSPAQPESDPLRDLEAELLSDLQASFKAVRPSEPRVPPEPPSVEPPAATTPPQPEPASPPSTPSQAAPQGPAPSMPDPSIDELLRELQVAGTGQTDRTPPPEPTAGPPQTPAAPASPPRTQELGVPPVHQPATPSSTAPAAPPVNPPRVQPPAGAPRPSMERAARPPIQPPPPSIDPPARPAATRTAAPERTAASGQPRAVPGARAGETPSPAPRAHSSRWDKPAEPARAHAAEASRFAPPGAATAQPRLGESADNMVDEEDLFVENAPFLESGDDQQDDMVADGLGAVPGYGDDDDQLLPFPEEELENLVKRRSHRGLALVAILLAVVLAGSVALLMFRSNGTSGSPPPIIAADGSPTKVAPEETAAEGDPQSKLIYDRVDSGESETDTTLLTFDDDPIDLQQSGAAEDDAITRVILPGASGADDASTGGETTASDTTSGGTGASATGSETIQPLGPKRVRTVVVRPDGTIVSSEAAAVDDNGEAVAATETTVDEETPPAGPMAMQTPEDDTAAIAAASGLRSGDELSITQIPEVETVVSDNAADEVVDEPLPVAPAAQAPAQAEPTIVATGGDNGPIDVTPGQPASATTAPAETEVAALPPGSFLVQVSSQRSEDSALATYQDLQSRYPAILGAYQPIIQRADLGDRGIFFRVRIGPFSGSDAERLCSDLKDAGGDCILARN